MVPSFLYFCAESALPGTPLPYLAPLCPKILAGALLNTYVKDFDLYRSTYIYIMYIQGMYLHVHAA